MMNKQLLFHIYAVQLNFFTSLLETLFSVPAQGISIFNFQLNIPHFSNFSNLIVFHGQNRIWFLDAIASPSTYHCQSVGESLIVSDLEIVIASLSFASLLVTSSESISLEPYNQIKFFPSDFWPFDLISFHFIPLHSIQTCAHNI